ncbi:MAG TPA: hypothetical protein VGS11_09290 [Candidatus Bathyarchaeia archaeon]|nr:hypothetical protein [Candidatus Bathyarchaeia archaeon]
MVTKAKTVVVNFQPPETYGGFVSKIVDPVLDEFSHFLILDSDTTCDFSAETVAEQYREADVVGFNVISSSRIFGAWEKMTYWLKLSPRVRGCAMLLSSDFLRRIGGYPRGEFVDTVLLQKSNRTIVAPFSVHHLQRFDLRHSIWRQVSDGKFRAELRYPFWKTLLHSIFRVRPFVVLSYVFHRLPKE